MKEIQGKSSLMIRVSKGSSYWESTVSGFRVASDTDLARRKTE